MRFISKLLLFPLDWMTGVGSARQKDEAAPKPVVTASLLLSSAVLLPTLAEKNSGVKVERPGL